MVFGGWNISISWNGCAFRSLQPPAPPVDGEFWMQGYCCRWSETFSVGVSQIVAGVTFPAGSPVILAWCLGVGAFVVVLCMAAVVAGKKCCGASVARRLYPVYVKE